MKVTAEAPYLEDDFRWQVLAWIERAEADDAETAELVAMLDDAGAFEELEEAEPIREEMTGLSPRQLGATVLSAIYNANGREISEFFGINQSGASKRLAPGKAKPAIRREWYGGDKTSDKAQEQVERLTQSFRSEEKVRKGVQILVRHPDSVAAFRMLPENQQKAVILTAIGIDFQTIARMNILDFRKDTGDLMDKILKQMRYFTLHPPEPLPSKLSGPEARKAAIQFTSQDEWYEDQKKHLTDFQVAVLEGRANGERVIDIAERLGLSDTSTTSHLHSAIKKLDRLSRGQYTRNGPLDPASSIRELLAKPKTYKDLANMRGDHAALFVARGLGLSSKEASELIGVDIKPGRLAYVEEWLRRPKDKEPYPERPTIETLRAKLRGQSADSLAQIIPRMSEISQVVVKQMLNHGVSQYSDLYDNLGVSVALNSRWKHISVAHDQFDALLKNPNNRFSSAVTDQAAEIVIADMLQRHPEERIEEALGRMQHQAATVARMVIAGKPIDPHTLMAHFSIGPQRVAPVRKSAVLQLRAAISDRDADFRTKSTLNGAIDSATKDDESILDDVEGLDENHREAYRRFVQGNKLEVLAKEFGMHRHTVSIWVTQTRRRVAEHSGLSLEQEAA